MASKANVKKRMGHGQRCPYCNHTMIYDMATKKQAHPRRPTRDHLVPKRYQGRLTIIVCQGCNGDKGGDLIEDWYIKLKGAGDERAPIVFAFIEENRALIASAAVGAPVAPLDEWEIARVQALYPDKPFHPAKPFRCRACKRQFGSLGAIMAHFGAIRHFPDRPVVELIQVCDLQAPDAPQWLPWSAPLVSGLRTRLLCSAA